MNETVNEVDKSMKEQILEQIPTPVIAVDLDMNVTFVNEKARLLVNKSKEEIIGKKCYQIWNSTHCNTDECCMKKSIVTGNTHSARMETNISGKEMPIEYFTVPLRNEDGEIVGGLEFLLDITERVLYEERLQAQSKTIRQMSTPTIKLWDGVLVLPIVGVIDSIRAQHMMETMLNKIAETYSRVIILDIHGVAAVDTAVANHLMKITKATKLMGCECILSGISPAVAQTIIHLGIDMTSINTKSTLSDALDEAFNILGLEVVSKK